MTFLALALAAALAVFWPRPLPTNHTDIQGREEALRQLHEARRLEALARQIATTFKETA